MNTLRDVVRVAMVTRHVPVGGAALTIWFGALWIRDVAPGSDEFPAFLGMLYVVTATVFTTALGHVQTPVELPALPVSPGARSAGVALGAGITACQWLGPVYLVAWAAPEAVGGAIRWVILLREDTRELVTFALGALIRPGPHGPVPAGFLLPSFFARLALHAATSAAVSALARGDNRRSAVPVFIGLALGWAGLGGAEVWRGAVVLALTGPLLAASRGVRVPTLSLAKLQRPVGRTRPYATEWRGALRDGWGGGLAAARTLVSITILIALLPTLALGWRIATINRTSQDVWLAILPRTAMWLVEIIVYVGMVGVIIAPAAFPAGAMRLFQPAPTELPGLPVLPMSRKRYLAASALPTLVGPLLLFGVGSAGSYLVRGEPLNADMLAEAETLGAFVLTATLGTAWRSPYRDPAHMIATFAVFVLGVTLTTVSGYALAAAVAGPMLAGLLGLGVVAVLRGGR